MSGEKKDYEIIDVDKDFFDDEFGVYYDGEFYEEVEAEPVKPAAYDNNEALIREIARLRNEIKGMNADKPAAQPAAAAPRSAGESEGYRLMIDLDALKAFIKNADISLPEKIEKMLDFNRRISNIPYGRYDEIAAAYGILKDAFLKQTVANAEAIDVIGFKGYSYEIVSEADEINAREFILFKEIYNPGDEQNFYEIAGRLAESKNKLQDNLNAARNEELYSQILDASAELLTPGALKAECRARINILFGELTALKLDDIINFPKVVRPGQKPADAPGAAALTDEIVRMRAEIERLKAETVAAENQPAPQPKPSPFIKRAAAPAVSEAAAPAAPPKPNNIQKAHRLARVIANRMILDSLMDEISEENLTREKRDKLVKKLVPGAARIDEQPKDLQKLANTLVVDKLTDINKKYERMQKLRDREIKKAAREKAAAERAEKLRQKQAAAEAAASKPTAPEN